MTALVDVAQTVALAALTAWAWHHTRQFKQTRAVRISNRLDPYQATIEFNHHPYLPDPDPQHVPDEFTEWLDQTTVDPEPDEPATEPMTTDEFLDHLQTLAADSAHPHLDPADPTDPAAEFKHRRIDTIRRIIDELGPDLRQP